MALPPLSPGTGLSLDAAGLYRYRVERELGSGGFGITYEAVHLGLGRSVVIKELACDAVSRRDADSRRVFARTNRESQHQRVMKRFIEEARLLSRLAGENCPHIVRVFDVFEEHGTAYYVMDRIETSGHVPCEPLRGADGMARALRLARELLVALEVAHRYTSLHGDIKPANLLLDSQDRLVLIDFGTARSAEDLARTSATAMHTPGYGPPELMSEARLREAGAWSDLYSWGMVVYGLLWRHPWQICDEDGATLAWPLDPATRMAAVDDPYGQTAHTQLCSRGLSAEAANLVCSCLSLVPSQRPQRVSDFLLAFDAATGLNARQPSVAGAAPSQKPSSGRTGATGKTPGLSGDKHPAGENPQPEQPGAESGGSSSRGPDSGSGTLSAAAHRRKWMIISAILSLLGVAGVCAVGVMVFVGWVRQMIEEARPSAPPPKAPQGFVYIAPGTFTMGSAIEEVGRFEDETPHEVTLTRGFFLQATEVTQAEWQALMEDNPSASETCGPSCPVEMVSWLDAALYANAFSRAQGLPECYDSAGNTLTVSIYGCEGYRLPTEAEWEYAARAGTTSNDHSTLETVAWYFGNSETRTHPVAERAPNAWGLYDTLGNVWEWTHDWYGPYGETGASPEGPAQGASRVFRGGSFYDSERLVRVATRFSESPDHRSDDTGFRLARSVP